MPGNPTKHINAKWLITWVPGRGGFQRGWVDDVKKSVRYVWRVVHGKVEYSRMVFPKNIPKAVTLEILEQSLLDRSEK